MADTNIEWAEKVWNPISGCSKVSAGCTNCYAEIYARRLKAIGILGYDLAVDERGHWTGSIELITTKLAQPIRWRAPRRVFVNSMSDLFHENVGFRDIERILDTINAASWHTYMVLTKRAERMLAYFTACEPRLRRRLHPYPPTNLWLGVSVEDQKTADERIPFLLQTPAAVRFVSIEPMLGRIDLENVKSSTDRSAHLGINVLNGHMVRPAAMRDFGEGWPHLDWVIVGGESGPKARPMHLDWPRSVRDQCVAAGVPFFFKQWGAWFPLSQYVDSWPGRNSEIFGKNGKVKVKELTVGGERYLRVGEKKAGRLLDGREWNELPRTSK